MLAVNVLILIIVIWIFISLIHYAVKYKKWRQNSRNQSEQLNAGLIYVCVIFCAGYCLFYDVAVLVYSAARFTTISVEICNYLSDALHFLYASVILSINLFLWLRQRVFYSNKALKVKFKKQIAVFSFLSIFIIFSGGLVGLLLVTIPYDVTSSVYGCIDEPSRNSYRNTAFYVIIISVVFGQSSLCFLFIYALKKSTTTSLYQFALSFAVCCKNPDEDEVLPNEAEQASKRRSTRNEQKNLPGTDTVNRRKRQRKTMLMVKLTIRKTILFAVLSVLSDLIVIFVVYRIPELLRPRQTGAFVGLFGCSLDLLFVILSFLSWKEMMMSPCFRKRSPRDSQINLSRISRNGATI